MDSEVMIVDDGNSAAQVMNGQRKKTWQELRADVRAVRCLLYSISFKLPNYFAFKKFLLDSGQYFYRIYFLSTISSGRETTLLYCDVSMDSSLQDNNRTFPWHPMLESTFHTYHQHNRFSRQEQFQLERKRAVSWGLTFYHFLPIYGRFVFPASGSIFYCDDNGTEQPPFFPKELKSANEEARLNPQICPHNSNLVAYVHNSDLWVYNLKSSCDVRLTFAKKGTDIADDPISAGLPSYVTQEEFNRYTGYWWQPVATCGPNVYRILYEEVDECDVEILRLPCYTDEKELEEYRFPRAGTSNAKSSLKMVQFSIDSANQIETIIHSVPSDVLHTVCPDFEYLVRAGWTPDGKNVWAKVLDRQQSHEQIVLVPLTSFVICPPLSEYEVQNHLHNVSLIQVIYEERSDIWINAHDVLHFFPQENPREIKFLCASEETGYRHLYIFVVELYMSQDADPSCSSFGLHGWNVANRIKEKIALTRGEWEVHEQDVWVNEKMNIVFFIGLKDTPLERHLYYVDLIKPEEPIRLTTKGFSHVVAMDQEYSLFVTVQSNISQPPFGQVYQVQYSQSQPVKVNVLPLGYFLEPSSNNCVFPHPELFTHQLQSGHLIYGMLFKPQNMQPGEQYPTVLTIYGGPEVQLVTNTFKGMRSLRHYQLANAGYVVVAVDCRGSRHRGMDFESHIKGRMGTVEIADQVEVLMWLTETTGFIDPQRIAVHGWSYGGYLSLMGLAQRPDVFKMAIAGAPVTSWSLYDTGYTERYMNTPSKNMSGYSTGSVLSYINQLPDEENRLLLIHGLMDENVHFKHTTQLINALVKAGKPYHLQVYPTERHSLRHLDASEHYETTLLSFLQQHL